MRAQRFYSSLVEGQLTSLRIQHLPTIFNFMTSFAQGIELKAMSLEGTELRGLELSAETKTLCSNVKEGCGLS